jgi:hypothetical protein
VRQYNSVFHDVLKRVPWAVFERLVAAHEADRRVHRLPTKSQFIALLYGQLCGVASLREIVGGLESHSARLCHAAGGRCRVRRWPMPTPGARRPSAVFGELFAVMVGQAQRLLRRRLEEGSIWSIQRRCA